MKSRTLTISVSVALFALLLCAACGGSQNANNSSAGNTNTANASSGNKTSTTTGASGGEASAAVKAIYDNAMKRNCAAIPPMLTEDFRKEVGTSQDALEALCDSFTDSGKMTSYEVTGEEISGDSATVKTSMTYKDGKKDNKTERMKKVDGKWLMQP